MYLMIKRVLFCLSFALVIFGCTDKENTINITQSDLYPLAGQINSINEQFTFRDEISVNGENYKLLVGNTQEVESQAIISFAYLPDNVEYITDASLTIYTDLKAEGDLELKFKRLEQDYLEASATWDQAEEGQAWNNDLIFDSDTPSMVLSDTIATSIDTLVFDLSEEEILTWTQQDLSLLSFIIYTESDNYIEIYSSENSINPNLKFTYRLNSETEEKEYDRDAFKDTSIINDKQGADQTWSNVMEISNMLPKRSYLKFDMDTEDLLNQENNPLSEFQLNHLTVNEAIIRLYFNKEESSFFGDTRTVSLTAFRVKSEVNEPKIIESDDMEYLINTGTSTKTIVNDVTTIDSIDVKITPILQGFISGEKENFGIVLRSNNQSRNFDAVKFYGMDAENEDLRPKVKFIYTLPIEE